MSPSHKHVRGECLAVREVLNRVGDKWSVLIVALWAISRNALASCAE
jgi:DNA-binding HxlR family transcriptional regulator